MKIALLGYGKMGHEIEAVALRRGHDILFVIDSEDDWKKFGSELGKAEVAIDFSTPESAIRNMRNCFDAGTPVVCGTTGWHDQQDDIRKECIEKNGTLFYASNFSIGMNIFFEINRRLAGRMNSYENYSAGIREIHHIHKSDKPSGTAITLANDIVREIAHLKKWSETENPSDDELPVRSVRHGEVPGTHTVSYDSESDTIEITHTAKNRRGFANGAILAAEFIINKRGIYGMNDLLKAD